MTEENSCAKCNRGYCFVDEFCMECRGQGKTIDIAIGLGQNTLVPSYVETTCKNCHGVGFIRHFCPVYWNED